MYGDTTGVEEGKSSEYFQPGLHQVFIESLTLNQSKTESYEDSVVDVVLTNGKLKIETRIFPFKYNPDFTEFNSETLITEDKQSKDYRAKNMHLFNKAIGVEEYKSLIDGAQSFEEYIQRLSSKVTRANGGKDFRILIIEKNGFSKYPMWKGGCAETLDSNGLSYDPEKHGPIRKTESMVEQPAGGTEDNLPF